MKTFLAMPVEERLEELPKLIGILQPGLYEELKAKCDATAQIFRDAEFVEGQKGNTIVYERLVKIVNDDAYLALASAFRFLLHQLFLESLLFKRTWASDDDPMVDNWRIRKVWGVHDMSGSELMEQIQKYFSPVIKSRFSLKGRGGDRKSRSALSEEQKTKLRARRKQLTPFWHYLFSELRKHNYAHDVWPWLRSREEFQQTMQSYEINDLSVVDALIPEALKRRPYALKEISGKMPDSLLPAALALQQACLEMGIVDTYGNLKQKLKSKKGQ